MKTWIVLSLILCASTSSAQFFVSRPNPTSGSTSTLSSAYQGVAPLDPSYGLGDHGVTPTMQRQRQERARHVAILFPHLEAEMARQTPSRARYTYARAEKKAMWANIRAKQSPD